MFNYRINIINDNIKMVDINGYLKSDNTEEFNEDIKKLIKPGTTIIFNMEKTKFLSCAGLRALLIAAKRLNEINEKGFLIKMNKEIQEAIEITGMESIYKNLQKCICRKEVFKEISKMDKEEAS